MKKTNKNMARATIEELWGNQCIEVVDETAGSYNGCIIFPEESRHFDCILIFSGSERPYTHRIPDRVAKKILAVPFSGSITLDIA